MRPIHAFPAIAVFAVAVPPASAATPDEPSAEERKSFERLLLDGRTHCERAGHETKPARKLSALRESVADLRRARAIALRGASKERALMRERADAWLLTALTDSALVHLERKALHSASDLVAQALVVDPKDPRALNLEARIAAVEGRDPCDERQGAGGLRRIRERREAAGQPLRPRGVTQRR